MRRALLARFGLALALLAGCGGDLLDPDVLEDAGRPDAGATPDAAGAPDAEALPDAAPPAPDAAPATLPREKFTLVVIPDSQCAVRTWPEVFYAETQWIANNTASRNIQYVIHVGDIQESAANAWMWDRANTAMSKLDGRVRYVIAIGNHDLDAWSSGTWDAIATDRSSNMFNSYFPRSRFAGWATLAETSPATKNDNSAHAFWAGGTDWLVVTLKFRPTAAEIAWANDVVAAYPDRQVIVNTHEYLASNGTRTAAGETLWNGLVRLHANIRLVVSGHISVARREDANDFGLTVYQTMVDYQDYNNRDPNSYLRIMEFDPEARTISVDDYSPYLDSHKPAGAGHFTLTDVDIMDP